ncbi:MAG: hypothetical protein CVV64_14100 [Candidatus Wallbacteria bacterium HGW-Wallbacteria-1]|jgi:HPt (histidine-containing phosphotransfer) domain-containing protein|uniref:HPt domain-containing protein n=1 Tax=Candidatus Wallbacteria bacterium HGW-Wallbacteria-1 TaxID=2013854 RepID=A0A2N1PMG7_9BACT|nr:MAG: hypothetical protein CVV64_14100 [Candidatus Wallbacteria bacterium HGW-Wallbacteria-1]
MKIHDDSTNFSCEDISEIDSGKTESIFPELNGIDTIAGLNRVIGNSALYREILLSFHDEFLDFEAVINKLILMNNHEDVRRLIHSLKGFSGNIGADELYASVIILENTLLTENPDKIEIFNEQLNTVVSNLHSVNISISSMPAIQTSMPAMSSLSDDADNSALDHEISALKSALILCDARSGEILKSLLTNSQHIACDSVIQGISEAISNFDYDIALKLLEDFQLTMMKE